MRDAWKTFGFAFSQLSRRGKAVLFISTITNVTLIGLDAAALLLLASALQESVIGMDSDAMAENSSPQRMIIVFTLFSLRSVLSLIVNWIAVNQLAIEESQIANHKFVRLLALRPDSSEHPDSQFQNEVDRIPDALVRLTINVSSAFAEMTSVLGLLGVFVYFDPFTAGTAIAYFTLVVALQHRFLATRSQAQGSLILHSRDAVYRVITDAVRLRASMNELSRRSITQYMNSNRFALSAARGRAFFLAIMPRYLLEVTLGTGVFIVGSVAYITSGSEQALATAALFAGIGFRILPSINRIQILALTVVSDLPTAKLGLLDPIVAVEHKVVSPRDSGNLIELRQVHFRYPLGNTDVISEIDLDIARGKQYAIVGPSGAGKTTLLFMLLCKLRPTRGEIAVADGLRMAFVPQDTHLAYMPLAENVSLRWHRDEIEMSRVVGALSRAGLTEYTNDVDDFVPLLNSSLSGGQKQRIGLARALYEDANLIVLDEVTSSLDAETEHGVVETLLRLGPEVTSVIVAHRLSTVRRADRVIYLENGRIVASGTFKELAETLPQFRRQIELGQIDLRD